MKIPHSTENNTPITGKGNQIKSNRIENIPNKPHTGPHDLSDTVSITEFGASLQSLIDSLKHVREIDTNRIAEIRAAIENGKFTIDEKKVAEALSNFELDL